MTKKILIVDDSIIARMAVKKAIPKDKPYELHEASDGLEGLEKFKTIVPDVTFLDLTMPVMTGFQALEEIKKIDKNALVIILTADIQAKTMEKVNNLGVFMMIKKPSSKEEIQDALEKAIKYKESR